MVDGLTIMLGVFHHLVTHPYNVKHLPLQLNCHDQTDTDPSAGTEVDTGCDGTSIGVNIYYYFFLRYPSQHRAGDHGVQPLLDRRKAASYKRKSPVNTSVIVHYQ